MLGELKAGMAIVCETNPMPKGMWFPVSTLLRVIEIDGDEVVVQPWHNNNAACIYFNRGRLSNALFEIVPLTNVNLLKYLV